MIAKQAMYAISALALLCAASGGVSAQAIFDRWGNQVQTSPNPIARSAGPGRADRIPRERNRIPSSTSRQGAMQEVSTTRRGNIPVVGDFDGDGRADRRLPRSGGQERRGGGFAADVNQDGTSDLRRRNPGRDRR